MAKILQGIPLKIDIVSDVVCPWCIIGYKQFQKALDMMAGQFIVPCGAGWLRPIPN